MDQTSPSLPSWAARLHGFQVAAQEGDGLEEAVSLEELVLRSHSLLMAELLAIQIHLGMDVSTSADE